MFAAKIFLPVTAVVLGGVAFATSTGSGASAPNPASTLTTRLTPNACIQRNGGDYNACNVGNSGRGDLPYQLVSKR